MAKRRNIPESEYLKGLNEAVENIQEAVDNLEHGSVVGLANALLYIATESQQRAPIDTGDLRGSVEVKINNESYAKGQSGGGITVNGTIPDNHENETVIGEVSYNTKYAANQHEHTEYDHPKGGQAKYLESVLVEEKDRILKLIAEGIINEMMKQIGEFIADFINKIFNMDCVAGMSMYPDKSIDMILCDLPYGVTDCRWDSIIPFDLLWKQYKRIIKDNGAIVLTACQPFTTKLISSQPKLFRYCWYWIKNMVTGFAFSKFQPLRCVEDICVFYKHAPTYNPQGIIVHNKPIINRGKKDKGKGSSVYHFDTLKKDTVTYVTNYPRQILNIPCERGLHPTQKPVRLFEYLIKTYTNPNELVLDNCMGSGTTAVACINTGRKYTGFEWDEEYYEVIKDRLAKLGGG